uniref:Poly [ADP-ribose] polymerase n=1 Tax=Oryzias latipes TaxID=8090 RepID=A0A3B3IM99_ORYLA
MRRTRGSMNKNQSLPKNEDMESITEWQWQGDGGRWESYPPAACALLDSALSAGTPAVTLNAGSGTAYEVDLKNMVQINPVTKYRRKIRSQTVKPDSLNEAEPQPVQVKEEEEETEEQPVTKKRRGRSKSQAKSQEGNSEVVKTVVMKGRAPVDPECNAKLGKAHVYSEGSIVYDVMLNQTNLQFNNNKFYLIQLLQDDSSKSFSVWMRWGRVGKVGQNSLTACGGDLLKAKDIFKKKFFDKTRNEWEQRGSFVKVAGKYDMVFMDYSTNEKEENTTVVDAATNKRSCKLDPKVQSLLELICDLKAMEECVLEMKFDTRKAPLGKLTSEQIRAGYAALKKIEECLKRKGSSRDLLEACNQFYTRIPHDFGLRPPPVIHTDAELKEKISLLEALSDIQIAVKMVQSSADSEEHPLDRHYHSLKCNLQPLDSTSSEFKVIEKYLQSTHAPTHRDYGMTVLDIFSVDRDGESESFLSDLHNRTLLWHGSRLSNWVGILSKGLRVAPPEAPVTGYMVCQEEASRCCTFVLFLFPILREFSRFGLNHFDPLKPTILSFSMQFGKGIYFADMSSKSANYCFANQSNHVGLLLLCEVALGDCNELLDADYEANNLPAGKHSTKGLGQTAPDPKNSVTLLVGLLTSTHYINRLFLLKS